MSRAIWLPKFEARLQEAGIALGADCGISSVCTRSIAASDWGPAAAVAMTFGCRWAGMWAEADEARMRLYCVLDYAGDSLLLSAEAPLETTEFTSQTPHFPAADRMERHARDLFGVIFVDHPDPRRWTRHCAWPENWHPLHPAQAGDPPTPGRTPADVDYPFAAVHGNGVFEIPVGPVHAGIIEPGHFRFHAAGEPVLKLEERLGYVHKGIERLAVGRDPAGLARLAARVSGDSAVAHAWAACQAMERAAGIEAPPRALALRGLLAERERVANHLGDIGAICNDVGFAFAHVQTARLRERWQRRNRECFGHRLLMDTLVPGGVARDLPVGAAENLCADHAALRREVEPLFDIIDDHPPLDDRLVGTGVLSLENARALGCTGYLGKASGCGFDLRRDAPYAPYDALEVPLVTDSEGDTAARVRVRMAEVRASLDLMDQLLDAMPSGETTAPLPTPLPGAIGFGQVEGWRGETLAWVRFDNAGRIARYFPRDPSWFYWPALERLIMGEIVPDFPVCNKSVNGSYSGVDL
ncbi:hydrogenase [Acidihalobacter ferrooxydans]|uniref:Hydrogenase n=2 Tax=Acidihalobacter ferrooxydans TaxID=1765967 RepID=A0A1P8UEL9_9GAMM|nr:NADH-quinone oxidoreductase subunit C [Acidihalobacter ferrooxydans]APZ42256.1 hydrogenase [Acidihalobacter ferrooxydans]